MDIQANCPLCDAKGISPRASDPMGTYSVDCRTCGRFVITREALINLRHTPIELWRISAVSREMHIRERPLLLADGPFAPQVEGHETVQASEIDASRFPRTGTDKRDRILLNLSRLSEHPGKELTFDYGVDYPVFFARNNVEAGFMGEDLVDTKYVKTVLPKTSDMRGFFSGFIAADGWNRISKLVRGDAGAGSAQAFVAMWFGKPGEQIDGRSAHEFLNDAFMNGFKVGIEKAGYAALRIDFKEFNDSISDQIIAEIRRSKFIVADFTGQRGGVYFEAGFAQGLGQQVVFTCHESDIAKVHFDTNHFKHILWTTPQDLATQLDVRIRATLGEGPLAPARATSSGRT